MKELKKTIEKYTQINIYRHISPDLDAYGSQLGLYYYLKEEYPSKIINIVGNRDNEVASIMNMPKFKEPVLGDSLGIVVDTANKERIDGDISMCKEIIKIDHHIIVDNFGDYNYVDISASSCSEIIALMIKDLQKGIPMNKLSAESLYLGLVADSNRFLYSSTSQKTFEAASYILDSNIDIEMLYTRMYMRSKTDLEVNKFILNHYQEHDGIAYFYLSDEDLNELGISRESGSQHVNVLSNVEEFEIWMAITENKEMNNYRVSLRSRKVPINEVANLFNGGGHAYASGATLNSLDELDLLIQKLKEKLNGQNI